MIFSVLAIVVASGAEDMGSIPRLELIFYSKGLSMSLKLHINCLEGNGIPLMHALCTILVTPKSHSFTLTLIALFVYE